MAEAGCAGSPVFDRRAVPGLRYFPRSSAGPSLLPREKEIERDARGDDRQARQRRLRPADDFRNQHGRADDHKETRRVGIAEYLERPIRIGMPAPEHED